jgi:hypothetical protein
MPFMQAFSGLLVPLSLATMLFFRAPMPFVLLTYVPLGATLATLVVEAVGLAEFNRMFGLRVRLRDYVKLVLGALPYQLLLAFAAIRASVREIRGERGWEKTEHVGAHRGQQLLEDQLALEGSVS